MDRCYIVVERKKLLYLSFQKKGKKILGAKGKRQKCQLWAWDEEGRQI